jgi:hypothetical protein
MKKLVVFQLFGLILVKKAIRFNQAFYLERCSFKSHLILILLFVMTLNLAFNWNIGIKL